MADKKPALTYRGREWEIDPRGHLWLNPWTLGPSEDGSKMELRRDLTSLERVWNNNIIGLKACLDYATNQIEAADKGSRAPEDQCSCGMEVWEQLLEHRGDIDACLARIKAAGQHEAYILPGQNDINRFLEGRVAALEEGVRMLKSALGSHLNDNDAMNEIMERLDKLEDLHRGHNHGP